MYVSNRLYSTPDGHPVSAGCVHRMPVGTFSHTFLRTDQWMPPMAPWRMVSIQHPAFGIVQNTAGISHFLFSDKRSFHSKEKPLVQFSSSGPDVGACTASSELAAPPKCHDSGRFDCCLYHYGGREKLLAVPCLLGSRICRGNEIIFVGPQWYGLFRCPPARLVQ